MTTYPYTATRVHSMKSELLEFDEYTRLMNMGVFEIINFLESNDYGEDITELSGKYKGVSLINIALNRNMGRKIDSLLKRLIKRPSIEIITAYIDKWIFNNLKLIVRININNLPKEELEYGIVPFSWCTKKYCDDLIGNNEKLQEVIVQVTKSKKEKLKLLFEKKDISSIENEIDKSFYRNILNICDTNSEVKGVLLNYLTDIRVVTNIRNILRLKYYNIDDKKIQILLQIKNRVIATKLFDSNFNKCVNILKSTKYSAIVNDIEDDITKIDDNIDSFILSYSSKLLSRKPLSLFPIFGYLIAKESEIRNLHIIINGKSQGLDNKTIKNSIIR